MTLASLSFDPLLPAGQWLAIASAGLAALAFYAWRRPARIGRVRWTLASAMSVLAFLALCLLLLNPTWTTELPPPAGKPVLTVLVDASGSMAAADTQGGTRFTGAADLARAIQSRLGQTFDVKIDTFDRTLRGAGDLANDTPAGTATDVAGAISAAVPADAAAGAAVVLLSDGIHNVAGQGDAWGGSRPVLDAARLAKTLDVPVFTRTFGEATESADLGVELRNAQDMAIVGQRMPLSVRVTHRGIEGGRAVVRLLENGREIAKREADFSTAAAGQNGADVHFLLEHQTAGVFPYEVRVDALAGETAQSNNSAAYVLRVVAEPIRVLVLEGKPYWDSKFLTRTLTADPAVAVDCVTKLTETRLLRRLLTHDAKKEHADALGDRDESWQITQDAKAYLASSEKLAGYQVVVLGREAEAFLSDAAVATLADWVARQGGSLVCYRGSPTATANAALEKLLPVKWTGGGRGAENRYRLTLTDRGEQMDWLGVDAAGAKRTVTGMPSLVTAEAAAAPKPLATVLATSVDGNNNVSPAIVFQPYGGGRVVVIEGAGMWRWAFLSPKFQQQEKVYTSLWHSFMRWLTSGANLQPGQTYNLRADKARFGTTEPATVTLLAREAADPAKLPAIELTRDGDAKATTFAAAPSGEEAGVYRVNFGPLPEGKYHAKLIGLSDKDAATRAAFDVRRYDQEQLDLRPRPDLMARIAADSGGAVIDTRADAASAVAKQFSAYRAKAHPPQVQRTAAWDRWWVMLGVIGLWAGAWFVRRGGGLV